jgi:hypothetical protein
MAELNCARLGKFEGFRHELGRILPTAGAHPRASITSLTVRPEIDFIIYRENKT